MMRSLLFLPLALAVACSDRKPAAPAPAPTRTVTAQSSGLGTVTSAEPVRVEAGFPVWRNGQRQTLHDGLLIRVEGVNGAAFVPGGQTPPLFVLGDTVGRILVTPFEGPQTLLLMVAPPPDTTLTLWMTEPGQSAQALSGAMLQAAQAEAQATGAATTVRTPPASTPRTTYATVDDLLVTTRGQRASTELCAQFNKQCGKPRTQYGMLDCGSCPTGQVCTGTNQCCTPETDAQFCARSGFNCGSMGAPDNCGVFRYSADCGSCGSTDWCIANVCRAQTNDCDDSPVPSCPAPGNECHYEPSPLVCVNGTLYCGKLVCAGTGEVLP